MNSLTKVCRDLDAHLENQKSPSEILWSCVEERLNNNAMTYYKKLIAAQNRIFDFIERDDILKTARMVVTGFNNGINKEWENWLF